MTDIAEAYLEPCRASKVKRFCAKHSILDVWQISENASALNL